MKKFLSVILAVLMICSVPMTCFATNAKTQETIVQSETENSAIASVDKVTINETDEFSATAVEVSVKAADTALSSMLGLKQENAFGPNTSGMSFFEKIWAWIVWFFNALTGRENARVLSITVPESLGVTEGEAVEFNYKIVYKDGYENTMRPSVVIADESIIKFDYKTITSDGQTVQKIYVAGLKPGTTTITVSCDDVTEVCTVTVKKAEIATANITVQYGEGKTRRFSRTVKAGSVIEHDTICSWIAEEGFDFQNNVELISMVSGTFGVAESGKTYNFTYTITDTLRNDMFEYRVCAPNAIITKYIGNETDVVVPETLGNYKVIGIDEAAFAMSKIKSVIVSDNVETIYEKAFRDCTLLEKVTIGKGTETIGDEAFYNCYNIKEFNYNSKINPMDVANWRDRFGYDIFGSDFTQEFMRKKFDTTQAAVEYYIKNAKRLGTINIGDSAKVVPSFLFSGSNFTEVNISDNTTGIDRYAFRDCMLLEKVTVGKNVGYIANEAFYNCYSIKEFNFNSEKDMSLQTQNIADSSFGLSVNEELSRNSLLLSESERIELITQNYWRLGAFNLGDTVKSLPDPNLTALFTTVVLGDGITDIDGDNYDLHGHWLLEKLVIGKSLKHADLPDDLLSLTAFEVDENNEFFASDAQGLLYKKEYRTLLSCPDNKTKITIANDVIQIDRAAFGPHSKLQFVSVDKNNPYYSNDENGILYNKDMSEVIFIPINSSDGVFVVPQNMTVIPDRAFYGRTNITSVVIHDNVTAIGNEAFSHCYNLTSSTISNSVTTIGHNAFYECTNLTDVIIPDSVTSIGNRAFYGCDRLTSVTIGNSVTTIGDEAFEWCGSLTGITVDVNNANYSSDSYGVLFNKNKTELIKYPAGNTRISYEIPDSVITIGNDAFKCCNNLTKVTIGSGVTTIGKYAFYNCDGLTDITIPDSVTTIGNYAFRSCYRLASVTIPDSVTTIGDNTFCYCESLTSVTIPEGVTAIGDWAFYGCDSLTSITIPDSVTAIGDRAFRYCDSLTDVTYTGTEDQWNNIKIDVGNDCLLNAPNKKFAVDMGTIVVPGETGTVIVTIYAPNNGPVSHLIVNMPVGTELNAAHVETYLYNEFGLDVSADNCDATIAKDKIYYATVYNTEETTKTATFEVTVWDSEGSRTVEISVVEGSTVNANIIEEILSANFETEAIADDFGTIAAVSGEKYTVTAYE